MARGVVSSLTLPRGLHPPCSVALQPSLAWPQRADLGLWQLASSRSGKVTSSTVSFLSCSSALSASLDANRVVDILTSSWNLSSYFLPLLLPHPGQWRLAEPPTRGVSPCTSFLVTACDASLLKCVTPSGVLGVSPYSCSSPPVSNIWATPLHEDVGGPTLDFSHRCLFPTKPISLSLAGLPDVPTCRPRERPWD